VWAPATLTHREKLTALVLADDANDRTRLTFHSVVDPEIMRQAMVPDDRAMRRIVARLKEEKILEQAEVGHNGRTAKFRFLHLAPAGSAAMKAGEKDPATDDVGGSESPAYVQPEDGKPVQNDPATPVVGGSFSASSRVENTLPTPAPPTTSSSTTAAGKPATEKATPARSSSSNHQVADELTAAFWEHHKTRCAQSFIAVRGVIRTAVGNGIDRDELARALDRVAREGRPISGGTLQIALQPPQQRPGGHQPYRNPIDQSVYDKDI
jgi:hypothetical protein